MKAKESGGIFKPESYRRRRLAEVLKVYIKHGQFSVQYNHLYQNHPKNGRKEKSLISPCLAEARLSFPKYPPFMHRPTVKQVLNDETDIERAVIGYGCG